MLIDNGRKQIGNEYTRVIQTLKTTKNYVITSIHKVSAKKKNSAKYKISDHKVINLLNENQNQEMDKEN